MKSKITVITGANAGIGYQTALRLATMGHRLILVVRNLEKGDQARNGIMNQVGNAQIDLVAADLSSQPQIRSAADQINQITPIIDTLVNNAGIWNTQRINTENGIEEVFAINHLSYFLLTHLLYHLLVQAGEARIINVSSDSHFKGSMHFGNPGLSENYHGLRSYAQSKLANVLFTYEFDRRKPHKHVLINAVQPGLVKTDIGIKHTSWLHALAWKIRRSSGVSAADGANTSVFLASSEEVSGISAKYWDNCKPKPSSKDSYLTEDAARLWNLSEEMCSITDYFGGN